MPKKRFDLDTMEDILRSDLPIKDIREGFERDARMENREKRKSLGLNYKTAGKDKLLKNQLGPKAQKELGTKLLTGEISEKQFNKGVDKVVDSTIEKGQSQTYRTKGKQRILEGGGPKTYSRAGAGLSMLKNRFRNFGAKKWWRSKTH